MHTNYTTSPKNIPKKAGIEHSRHYQIIKTAKKWLDDYNLDGFIGLIPIVGDITTQFFSYSFLYIAIVKLKSYRLTVTLLFNILIDIFIGLIPYAGTVLDFVHRSYKYNFDLVIGYANNDPLIVRKVNKRAGWATAGVIVALMLIITLIWLIITTFSNLYSWIFHPA